MNHSTRQLQIRSLHRSNRRDAATLRRGFIGLELLDPRVLMSGSIAATVYEDVNRNGIVDAADHGLPGWTVFVDLNKDGIHQASEPQLITDSNGTATFTGLAKGTYDVREVLQSGWSAGSASHLVNHISVNDNVVTPTQFLNTSLTNAAIGGTVWNDLNGDGIRDASDPGLSGWTVYIDANSNHTLDAGETTALTDANGVYSFPDLLPGTYKIRQVIPAGWVSTLGFDGGSTVTLSGGTNATVDFGVFGTPIVGTINGTVWNDVNADGFRALSDPGIGGWTVFLDANNNGVLDAGESSAITDAAGRYSMPSVPVGTYHVAEVLQSGWNLSPGHPASATVTVVAELIQIADFAVFTPTPGTIGGEVWNDVNGDGLLNPGEPGLSGWTVFIDQNADGILNAGEPSAVTDANGLYTLTNVAVGANLVREVPAATWTPTAPATASQLVTVLNGSTSPNVNFGNKQRTDSGISGTIYFDANHNGTRDAGERGLPGITVYLDTNNNGVLDAGEPSTTTSIDLFFTPALNEAGTYQFSHLAAGDYVVREIVPVDQSATPAAVQSQSFTLAIGELRSNVDFANQYRANEIHGVKFEDLNRNNVRDPGEPGIPGVTVYIDVNRNDVLDAGEPTTVTDPDGAYSFTGLTPGAYIVREVLPAGYQHSYPTTGGGILWPAGVSNPAIGNVTPTSITQSLADGQTFTQTVSLTLPSTGALTNKVDVFLLFDDTGSFTGNSPIVRAAFPQIISSLQANLPGTDLGFGVGRFEEYANFAAEFPTGRPFILNQSIVSDTTTSFSTSIQAALNRTAPGYGGDQPETDIEALFQMVTGAGFDGNNNGTTTDSGPAGLANTQVNPGPSGDVPAFSSFTADAVNNVLPPEGTIGGAGFRDGALPIILLATDTGFAYQPKGETSITGAGGLTLPISQLTQLSRPTTPFNSGAGIQETITGLNALGALVIGLGTNSQTNLDPRQQLESIAKLTGAINRSTTSITNGTPAPILPGDPLYFQIASGFGASVANGVINAIQNAASNVAVDITLKASDPRVHITMNPGVVNNVGAGQTATFDVTFTGDGRPHRFDLQFVRQGTNVVLGSIPVVLGTPVAGEGYEYEDLQDGEIHHSQDLGSYTIAPSGAVRGTLFEDRNGNNTLDAGEPTSAGATVYLDLNNNGVLDAGEPTAVTSATGDYLIKDVTPGDYTVRQVLATGVMVTGPSGNAHAETITNGGVNTGRNFGSFPTVFSATGATGSAYYVRGNGTKDEIWVGGGTPVAAPTYSIDRSALPSLTFVGGASNDTLIVDASLADASPSGGISFDGGAGSDTVDVLGTSASDNITTTATSATINGTSVTFSNSESLIVDPGAGADALLVNGGTVHIPASTGAGILARTFSSLSVAPGAHLDVDVPTSHANRTALITGGLSVDAAGTLDLGDNDAIVHNADATAAAVTSDMIIGRLKLGRSGGASIWSGTGITSSTAAGDPLLIRAVGVAVNNNGLGGPLFGVGAPNGPFAGQDATVTDVLVKETYYGDSNLDGSVNAADFSRIDNGFVAGLSGWINGDFNYDGAVNAADYSLIDSAFAFQSLSTGPLAIVALASPVKPMVAPPAAESPFSSKPIVMSSASFADLVGDRSASPLGI